MEQLKKKVVTEHTETIHIFFLLELCVAKRSTTIVYVQ